MNRRQFTTALSAIAAAPALPLKSVTAAPAAMPNATRFWAIYMSHLHGNCSPKTLSMMTGLDIASTQGHLTRLIRDGVIRPTHLVAQTAGANSTTIQKSSNWKKPHRKIY